MAFTPTSPVAGPNIAALSSPTYTLTADSQPSTNGKQYVVSALGGTQTSVDVHKASAPFTLSAFKPANVKSLPPVNPVTGVLPQAGNNVYTVITRKACEPLSGQAPRIMIIRTEISVPAGCEVNDLPNVAAALSLHLGAIYAEAGDLGTLVQDAVLG